MDPCSILTTYKFIMVLCQGEQNYVKKKRKKKKRKIKRTFIFIIVLYSYPLDMNPKVMKIENIFNVYLIKKKFKNGYSSGVYGTHSTLLVYFLIQCHLC